MLKFCGSWISIGQNRDGAMIISLYLNRGGEN